MRVVDVHPGHGPVSTAADILRFGSAPDNDVVPGGAGVEPHHASIVADARGLVLEVRPGCQRVYVNARAVRETALLRYGDTLTLGTNKYTLTTDLASPPPAAHANGSHVAVGGALLRIVSGVASGQALAVAPELRLGAGSPQFGELGYACKVIRTAEGLAFESGSAAARVNGWPCDRATLGPGDQIVLGEHRLLVEAPDLEYAAREAALPPRVAAEPAPEPEASAPTEIWWLIAAGSALAVVIAGFLYFRW